MQEARFYRREGKKLRCLLCPRHCLLAEGGGGSCGVRQVRDGKLVTMNYGLVAAAHWDPVEKKPLYHFYPGKEILSLGTYGCNLHCRFCQNWSLARGEPHSGDPRLSPEQVLEILQRRGGPEVALGVAYTYNEPTIWFEFVFDTARLLHRHGYKNVLVTNGYISREPLEELLPYIDALNIDVKGFSDRFYREYCRGEREPVLQTVELASRHAHLEATCLLIPTLNDSPQELALLVDWLASFNPEIPLHFSRYHPDYKLNLPPTPLATLERARQIALEKMPYVYLGNVNWPGAADTFCPSCRAVLIRRSGYQVSIEGLQQGRCAYCGKKINLVF
ncbi:MAG: AmmeMemoRadiSam system radical SAM enzyme [Dethiobacteria bacterium]|mgnify:CR=1 FL=1|nr:AmmeMemoRadiSam system radical SAM enzyme [Bacillota bacterium]HOP68344.1 AmmeMemoRadiSam system radical SAM enzyme [Bacillota bacterium]HPT33487.1 AmmeMemoRadiSam system radical SAM enzyme [Bacillota bacterium]HPZ63982.1 AmmeMemoRadiSam system radical SAM enzyme [Bacillota bacterium]HQD05791.1 AmmeMemoRadiSam system radical SAM enzyme [Bacillota bacterium]